MLPLAGLRVLDLSRVLAGPYCCALLGDLGADVIKVERPGTGDENRRWGHLWHGVGLDFLNVNRNKRDMTINLHAPEGLDIIRKLVPTCDVLVHNFVPGTMERFGLTYADLRRLNTQLIYCSISGFGESGPLARKPGYDGALQAFGGHMHITGEPDGGPVRMGASVIDMTTGIVAYGAILTALLARERTGEGQAVSASLLKTSLALMGTHGAVQLNTGIEPRRAGSGVSHLAPYGAYRTHDSHVVAAALNEESWAKLCRVLGLEALVADPRFADPQRRLANRKELDALLTARFMMRPSAEWIELFEQAGLVIAPVNTLGQALAHEQVRANDMLTRTPMPEGELTLVGGPMSFSGWETRSPSPPPALGSNTDTILTDLGYDDSAVARLRDAKVV